MQTNEDSVTPAVAGQISLIHKKRLELLKIPGDEALERILNARHPAALVHSLSVEDFYFLMNDIGVHDALPLLALASFQQWEYILDIEIWENERLSSHAGLFWIDTLLKANPQRYLKWTIEKHIPLFELLLFRNIEVYLREPGFDPNELYDDLFTVDDVFYVRFKPPSFINRSDDEDAGNVETPEQILQNLMGQLAAYDYDAFQKILLESASVIPAEVEEEAYRLRNVRLAEKGFLPYSEAIGVYQPIQPKEIKASPKKYFGPQQPSAFRMPVPLYPAEQTDASNQFLKVLLTIDADHILHQLQSELAGLCNRVAVADQKTIKNRTQLQEIISKTSAYINIGLEYLCTENPSSQPSDRLKRYRDRIIKTPLSQIFRVGYGKVLELKWKAQKWRRNSWFEDAGLALTFWDEEWLGVLGGLFIRRPLFFDNYRTGQLYREFKDVGDIRATGAILNRIMGIDAFFSGMALPPPPQTNTLLTWKNFLLTLWAQHFLGLEDDFLQPLSASQLNRLLAAFRSDWKHSVKSDANTRRSLLSWFGTKTSLSDDEISRYLGSLPDDLLNAVKDEYGRVTDDDIDPRYVQLFLTESL